MTIERKRRPVASFGDSETILNRSESLAIAMAQLQAANNYLTRQQQLKPHVRIVLNALASARLLALWHCTGYLCGRRAALSFGMSEHKFYYGRAMLCAAQVYVRGTGFTTTDPAHIEDNLSTALEVCLVRPRALYKYVPPSRRPARGAG